MEEQQPLASLPAPESPPSLLKRVQKALGPVGVALVVAFKWIAKAKYLLFPILKYGVTILKTGGSMLVSIGFYAMLWGWQYAVGFVLLIFVHECGHLLVARRFGLPVSAPMFIPFMGAFIALKDAPKNAWMEAWVGIGGPLLGTAGAFACELLFHATGNPLFRALAFSGCMLNLFNLMPVGMLDGGRIVTALSPWLWLIGFAILLVLTITSPSFLLILILVMSAPRLFSLFRKKTEVERRYFEVTPSQRAVMAGMYFGLILLLGWGMSVTHVTPTPRPTIALTR